MSTRHLVYLPQKLHKTTVTRISETISNSFVSLISEKPISLQILLNLLDKFLSSVSTSPLPLPFPLPLLYYQLSSFLHSHCHCFTSNFHLFGTRLSESLTWSLKNRRDPFNLGQLKSFDTVAAHLVEST